MVRARMVRARGALWPTLGVLPFRLAARMVAAVAPLLLVWAGLLGRNLARACRLVFRAVRAAVARGLSRLAATAVADESDAFEMTFEDLPRDGAIGKHVTVVRTPSLMVRQRLVRAAGIVATVGVALFVVAGGPATLWDAARLWVNSLTPPVVAAPRPHLNASFWVARRLPFPANFVRGVTVAPSAASSNLAYACWLGRSDERAGVPTVNLYLTDDRARSWSALTLPSGLTGRCQPVPDAADASRVLLVLTGNYSDTCAEPRVLASADRGAHWTSIALPAALRSACDLTVYQVRGVLYAWSPTAQSQPTLTPAAPLLESQDNGATWTPVFGAAGPDEQVAFVASRGDGTLLVLVGDATRHTLWCRVSPVAKWRSLGDLPSGTSAAFAASGAHTGTGCAWGAIYAAGYEAGQDPALTRLAIQSAHGWNMVAALPAPEASSRMPLGVDGQVLRVGPDGILLAETIYTGPTIGLAAGGASPAHTFWGWNPRSGRWLSDVHVVPANSYIEGFVWDDSEPGVQRLLCWIYALNTGIPAYTGLYLATFATTFAPAQDANDDRPPGL